MTEPLQTENPETLRDHTAAIAAALDAADEQRLAELLVDLTNSEIGDVLEGVPPAQRRHLWRLIGPDREGEVLVHVNDEVRTSLINDMDQQSLLAATESLDLDDLADIMDDLPADVGEQVLESMDIENRERLHRVLSYPEDSAGGLMNPDVITVRADVTLEVVQRYLRLLGEVPQGTDALYAVDRNGHYVGRLSLTDILMNEPSTLVEDYLDVALPSIPVTMSATDVALEFEHNDLVAAPVLDENGVLLGQITIDDVVDVIRDEAEHSVLSMAGMDEEADMFAPVWKTSRRRMLFLGVNLVTALIASVFINLFEATLAQVAVLAVFMPVVANMGGVAGTQTLTLMIRGMATGQVGSSNFRALLWREMAVGVSNGLVWALVVFAVAVSWKHDPTLGLVFGSAMFINLCAGAVAGVAVPVFLQRVSIDPALAGGMLLTTVTDVTGFVTFLGLGTVLLLNG